MFICVKGLIEILKIIENFFHCMVIGCFECSDAGAKHVAHVLVLHLFKVLEVEDGSLLVGQRADGRYYLW